MNGSKFVFAITVMLFTSCVFAQNTHMGVPAKDMVVLRTFCSNFHPSMPPCDIDPLSKATIGSSYQRIFADGSVESDFTIPLRKVLVITDYEWSYSESTVLEDSTKAPVTASIGFATVIVTSSQSDLKVAQDDVFTQTGRAFGELQMTSGFVVSVVPQWTLNRNIPGAPDISKRYFSIAIRGYLLDVP